MYKVLLVDDDKDMAEAIKLYNEQAKTEYDIEHISSGKELDHVLMNKTVDLILMDWNLGEGEKSGLDLIKDLKNKTATAHIPMILLTGKDKMDDQILGLNQGADDYVVKMNDFKYLFAKMSTMLRRLDKGKHTQENLRKKFIFKDDTLELEYLGQVHKLTHKEFVILKTLVSNPQRVFGQDELNALTSGKDIFVSRRCIDTFVAILRKKIGKECIVSVRKKGYKINDKALTAQA